MFILFAIAFLISCNSNLSKQESLVVVSYNVHNFFDEYYTGVEYPEFSDKHWTQKKYERKLSNIGNALKNVYPKINLLVLSEIEKNAANDLQKYYLPHLTHIFSAYEEGLGIVVLTQFPIKRVKIHNFYIKPYNLRSIVEVVITTKLTNEQPMSVFGLHFKSKRGKNEDDIEKVQNYQMNSLIKLLDSRGIYIVAGDFNNDDHAILLFDMLSKLKHYSCYASIQCATYKYQDSWLRLDGIYISNALYDFSLSSTIKVLNLPPFVTQAGDPAAISRVPFERSLSDHLPLQLTLWY